jgi:hypothetical protein
LRGFEGKAYRGILLSTLALCWGVGVKEGLRKRLRKRSTSFTESDPLHFKASPAEAPSDAEQSLYRGDDSRAG